MRKKRTFLLLCPVLLIVALLLTWPVLHPAATEEDDVSADNRLYVDGMAYYPKTLETLLFIGVDSSETAEETATHNGMQSDFLALLIVDHREQTYSVLHLNRDTMCEVPTLDSEGHRVGTQIAQLAFAHTYGSGGKDSCLNTVSIVSHLLYGVEILHYASIPIADIGKVNDAVGGVNVLVEDDFSAVDPTLVQGTVVHLTGAQAEHFVRARGGMTDSTNLRRMARQQQYMEGFLQAQQEDIAQHLMEALGEDLVTDLSISKAASLAEACSKYRFTGLKTLPGEAKDGREYVEYILDDTALRQLILDMFYRPITARSVK